MKAVFILTTILLTSSCSTFRFPGVHRINVQQGNVISQIMIDKLKPGMTKSQVRFILGNPVINDPLRQNRWNYIYSIQLAGNTPIIRSLTLHFKEQRLSYFEGDFAPTDETESKDDATGESDSG